MNKKITLYSVVYISTAFLSLPAGARNSTIKTPGLEIRFEKEVPEKAASLLKSDLERLSSEGLSSVQPSLLELLEVSDSRGTTLSHWLGERVHAIVNESFQMDASKIFIAEKNYRFENPGVFPVMEIPNKKTDPEGDGPKTVMTNIGSALYIAGKNTGNLVGMNVKNVGKLEFSSPRVGLIKIGPGLMAASKRLADITDDRSYARYAQRIAVLFHEARHSDGNGKSLGFFHAICPEGHDYAGYSACDRNLNGPYTVGAEMLKGLAASCTDAGCPEKEAEALRLLSLDSFDRILKTSPAPKPDTTAQQSLALMIQTCEMLAKMGNSVNLAADDVCAPEKLAAMKAELAAMQTGSASEIPSTKWDPRPEGKWSR